MHIKLALTVGIISLILIGLFAFKEESFNHASTAPERPSDQLKVDSKDPFKEFLEKKQQKTLAQPIPTQLDQPEKATNGNSSPAIEARTDPFKNFLESQAKALKADAKNSPFGAGK